MVLRPVCFGRCYPGIRERWDALVELPHHVTQFSERAEFKKLRTEN